MRNLINHFHSLSVIDSLRVVKSIRCRVEDTRNSRRLSRRCLEWARMVDEEVVNGRWTHGTVDLLHDGDSLNRLEVQSIAVRVFW